MQKVFVNHVNCQSAYRKMQSNRSNKIEQNTKLKAARGESSYRLRVSAIRAKAINQSNQIKSKQIKVNSDK